MLSIFILLILSILSSILIYIPTNLYSKGWYFVFVFIAVIIIFYLIYTLLYVLFVIIYSLTINTKKELKKPSKFAYHLAQQLTYMVKLFLNTKVILNNSELMPKDENYLLISNHVTGFDPMFSIILSKNQPLICITKPENLSIPVFGKIMYKAGFIPIDRNNDFEAIKSISKAAKILKNKEASILIYPEGKRSKTGELDEFHSGSFKIATRSGAPIIVIDIKNILDIKNKPFFIRKKVYFNVLKYIPYEEYKGKNTTEIADMCKNLILEDQKKD